MHQLFLRSSLAVLALVGAVYGTATLLRAEPQSSKPAPVAEVKEVMNYSNHKTHGLYGLVKTALKTEPSAADWKIAAARAVGIAEAGNTLMGLVGTRNCDTDEGRAKWAEHCAAFRDAAKELAKNCKMKKYAEAQKSLEVLEQRCEACHADHQPE